MAVKASRVKALYDVDAQVLLRDVADGAETATATETAVSLNELDSAYWHDGEIPHGVFMVVVNVQATDAGTGDETYTLSLLVDDTANLSDSPVTIQSQAVAAGFSGVLYFYVDSANIPQLNPESSGTDKWLAIRATLGGTTPSITYGAWIAKTAGPSV